MSSMSRVRHVGEFDAVGIDLEVDDTHLLADPDYLAQVVAHRGLAAGELYAAKWIGTQCSGVHAADVLYVRLELLRVRVGEADGTVHVAAVCYLKYARAGAAVVLVADAAVEGAAELFGLAAVLRRGVYGLLRPALVHVRIAPEEHAELAVLGAGLYHVRLAVDALIARGYALEADGAEALGSVQYPTHCALLESMRFFS